MRIISILFIALCTGSVFSQTIQDVSVELWADVQNHPPVITLNWVANANATGYTINRKLKSQSDWGPVVRILPGDAVQYIDTTVLANVSYEYRVTRQGALFTGYGYINSGIEIAAVEDRGGLILLMDSVLVDSLKGEIDRLVMDLRGDGWKVYQKVIPRTMPVPSVKAIITTIYNANTASLKAIFLLGHIPIPYSGAINVDGHADHTGAYPADVYYADMNSVWTDNVILDQTASDPRNHNIPKDGKFDQGIIPTNVELQIGRVDFFNMPQFAQSEIELMRRYLNKDHEYRHKHFVVDHRMLVEDNFGFFSGEAFAAGALRNGGPLVKPENVKAGDYLTDLASESFLWSYGCGGGHYQGAGGIGTTADLAVSDLQTVFTMLFGSYFGDWDTPNNFLRAALAQGKTLANVWSGRPHWKFHHMGLGETIGYSTRLTQNSPGIYDSNFGGRLVHIALMGDPTLKNSIVAPPAKLTLQENGYNMNLSWEASADTIAGYHIYRTVDSIDNIWIRVNEQMITDTFYTDSCLQHIGEHHYQVRAVKLEVSPSGSYFNLSQGAFGQINFANDPDVFAEFDFETLNDTVTFINTSINATHYIWNFDDGQFSTAENPQHVFAPGSYDVTLIAYNQCNADTFFILLEVFPTSLEESTVENSFTIFPNPSTGIFTIHYQDPIAVDLTIHAVTGELIFEKNNYTAGKEINTKDLPPGMYVLNIRGKGAVHSQVMVIAPQ